MKDEIEEKSWALESEQSKVKETSKINKDLKLKNQELREEIKNSKKNENKLETTERQIKKKLEKCEKEIKQKSDQIELDRKKWREFHQKYMLELKSLKKEKKQLEKRLKNDEKSEEKTNSEARKCSESKEESYLDIDSFMCNICFNSFLEPGVRPYALNCGHVFCQDCIHK